MAEPRFGTTHWPVEIKLKKAERVLEVAFDDGKQFQLSAEYLRVESPSAEVQGHGPSQRQIVPGCRGIAIEALEPVGNYALRIRFDDGHDTGIFTWSYLYELGARAGEKWPAYLAALAARGLSRDPAGRK
jgi:DUF971 family protein